MSGEESGNHNETFVFAIIDPPLTSPEELSGFVMKNPEVTCTSCAGQQQLLLASAAQDKYLRVWRIQHEAATTPAAADAASDTQDLAAAIARQVPV